MKYTINIMPKSYMRYDTAGDWQIDADGNITVTIMDTGIDDYNFLLILHELVESYLCRESGITTEVVDQYDLSSTTVDPGDATDCPYHEQHTAAVVIEKILSWILRVNWQDYEETLLQGDDEVVDY
jgi:hypothetical protein